MKKLFVTDGLLDLHRLIDVLSEIGTGQYSKFIFRNPQLSVVDLLYLFGMLSKQKVEYFSIQNNPISHFVEELIDLLENQEALSVLRLNDVELDDMSLETFASSIKSTLRVLDLSDNWHVKPSCENPASFVLEHKTCYTSNSGFPLSHVLNNNTFLKILNLSKTRINDDAAKLIVSALKLNYCIEVINVNDNNITHVGAGYFAEMLTNNKSLNNFDISKNPVGDEGAICIMNQLVAHPTLQSLEFSMVGLTDDAAPAIGNLLQKNPNLFLLDISCNALSTESAKLLLSILRTKSACQYFFIENDTIDACVLADLKTWMNETNQ